MLSNIIAGPLAFALTVTAAVQITDSCSDIHVISCRASQEAAGIGAVGVLGNNTGNSFSSVTMEALDYPATLSDYAGSSQTGTKNLQARLNNYTSQCPKAKIVLIGYSQVK